MAYSDVSSFVFRRGYAGVTFWKKWNEISYSLTDCITKPKLSVIYLILTTYTLPAYWQISRWIMRAHIQLCCMIVLFLIYLDISDLNQVSY